MWTLASAAEDVKVWRHGAGPEEAPRPAVARPRGPHAVRCVRFDNAGQLLGSCGDDGCIHIAPVPGGGAEAAAAPTTTLRPDDTLSPTTCFSFSSGSGYLSSGSEDGIIRVWDTKQRRVLQRFDDHGGQSVSSVSFSPNDAHIASGNVGGDVLIHGLVTQRLAATLPPPGAAGPANHLEYSRLRKSLLGTAMGDGSVYVWDVNALGTPFAAFPNQHEGACTGVAFSPVNHVLFASAAMDGKIVFYDVAQRKIVKVMPTESPITTMSFHDDGVTVAVGRASGAVAVYDLRSARGNKPLLVLPEAHDAALCPSGVRSVHFQRTRRERSRGTPKRESGSGAATPKAPSSARSDSTAASSVKGGAGRDSDVSSLRSSIASEREDPDNPPRVAEPPAAYSPAPASGADQPQRTPQSARQQKTADFAAKTEALLARLDKMSPAPEPALELAPGLAEHRAVPRGSEREEREAAADVPRSPYAETRRPLTAAATPTSLGAAAIRFDHLGRGEEADDNAEEDRTGEGNGLEPQWLPHVWQRARPALNWGATSVVGQ